MEEIFYFEEEHFMGTVFTSCRLGRCDWSEFTLSSAAIQKGQPQGSVCACACVRDVTK